jgi:hypothetical protein
MYGANITVVGRYSSAHQVVAWFFVSLHFHSAFLEYSTSCCLSFFFPCFPISICLKCISVQQQLACFFFFLFCSDWRKWVRDNRGSWSAHEEYTVASCWRYFWCFVSPNYDAVVQQLHDLQNFLDFLSGSFVFRIDCSSLISFHHGQDKMMLLMLQVLHFCIWGNAIYTRKIRSFSFWPEFPSIFCRRI